MTALSELDERIRGVRSEILRARDTLHRVEGELDGLQRGHDIVTEDKAGSRYDISGALEIIEVQIAQARKSKRDAQQTLRRLEGELQGLKKIRDIIGGEVVREEPHEADSRTREISSEWRQILSFILSRLPNSVSIGDVMDFVSSKGFDISRNAVRSQLHIYVNRHFLKRISDGHYKATDAIRRVC
ncbi:MAG: hypothetical protein ABL898_16815 [Hyphomicrobiaceae bacterium]|nr:hypothetical protein [Hyphomicrobiaceae bacterium]